MIFWVPNPCLIHLIPLPRAAGEWFLNAAALVRERAKTQALSPGPPWPHERAKIRQPVMLCTGAPGWKLCHQEGLLESLNVTLNVASPPFL